MGNLLTWLKSMRFGTATGLAALYFLRRLFRLPITYSYAQGSEDLIAGHLLRYVFKMDRVGTYVDVGCNAPIRYSNTFEFYTLGWRGILVDANAELIDLCKKDRPGDKSIRAAVSNEVREVIFHKSKEDAVSTIDETRLKEWKKQWEFADEDQEVLMSRTLTSILDENLNGSTVDLLSIDVEGHDLQVLLGLDLERYRPKVIIIEIHDLADVENNEIYQHLKAKGYRLAGFAVLSAYFIDERQIP